MPQRSVLEGFLNLKPGTGVPIPQSKVQQRLHRPKIPTSHGSTTPYKYTKLSPSAVQLRAHCRIQSSVLEPNTSTLVLWWDAYHRHQFASSKLGNITECGAGRMSKGCWMLDGMLDGMLEEGCTCAAACDNRMGKETNDRRDAFGNQLDLAPGTP